MAQILCTLLKKISPNYTLGFCICSKFTCHSYCLGYTFSESKQIKKKITHTKKDKGSLNRHLKTEVTADNLCDNEPRENSQVESRAFKV